MSTCSSAQTRETVSIKIQAEAGRKISENSKQKNNNATEHITGMTAYNIITKFQCILFKIISFQLITLVIFNEIIENLVVMVIGLLPLTYPVPVIICLLFR